MAEVFYLPQMGQTMTEATILQWLKKEGDSIQGWENLVEMMTDKINMEVDSQLNGTLLKILVPEGALVPVGAPIAVIGSPDEDITGLLAELSGGAPVTLEPSVEEVLQEPKRPNSQPSRDSLPLDGDDFPSVSPRARELAAAAGVDWKSLRIEGSGFDGMIVERDVQAFLAARKEEAPLATPLAAKIAADLGIDLGEVAGSGPRGRVRADDVRAAMGRRPSRGIQPREIPLQGMRRVIAQRLSGSYNQAVHVPMRVDVDMAAATDLRRQLNPALEPLDVKLTFTDLIAGAVVAALLEHPLLNATLENEVIRVHPEVHLGIAVALEEGLTVPVVAGAQNMTLPELSGAIRAAAKGARAGSLPPSAYAGGTFTLTNLGNFGIDNFDPIINPPQVAILGTGRIEERLVARGGAPAVRPMMTLTLCFDHRALDGAPAAQFLARVKELLESPARLLL